MHRRDEEHQAAAGSPLPASFARSEASRVRRPSDLLVGLAALAAVVFALALAHGLPVGARELDHTVAGWVHHHIPKTLAVAVATVVSVGCLGWITVAAVTLVRSDIRSVVNALSAFVLATGVASLCVVEWAARRGGVAVAMLAGTNATVLVLTAAFTALVTGADLARRPRWWRWSALAVVLLPLSELGLGDVSVFAAFAGPIGGWAFGLALRWGLTAASVRPSPRQLAAWLQSSGVPIASLTAEQGRGPGTFRGVLQNGSAAMVLLANRDTRGAGTGQRLWQSLRLRGGLGAPLLQSSRIHLQTQALSCYSAASAGVVCPRVLLLAEMPPETLVLALAVPGGHAPDASTPKWEAERVFGALRALHAAGVAHRDVQATSIVVDVPAGEAGAGGGDGDGAPGGVGFASMSRAQIGAGELSRRLDLAQALATFGRLHGPAVAVHAFRGGYRPSSEEETAVAEILQPIALASWGWSAMRAAKGCLAEVRTELVGRDGALASPPRLERFRWRTVLSTVGLTVAAYVLVGQLSKVDLVGAFETMIPGWFAFALAASAVTYFGAALNLAAFVPQRVSMIRGSFVQLSTSFVGVAMPPTVGHVAVNSRYLHRQGVNEEAIAAAVTLSQVVNVVTTVPLLLIIGILTGSGIAKLKIVPGTDVLIAAGCVVVAVGVFAAVPRTRVLLATRVWPRVRMVIPRLLEAVSQPLRLVVSMCGNLLLTAGYVAALYAALLALGAHPSVVATAGVYLAGNTVGSFAPTPGGLGAVELVLTAGLTGIGVPAHEAVAAVLLFRLATFWLPIPAGWVSFELLQRRGVL